MLSNVSNIKLDHRYHSLNNVMFIILVYKKSLTFRFCFPCFFLLFVFLLILAGHFFVFVFVFVVGQASNYKFHLLRFETFIYTELLNDKTWCKSTTKMCTHKCFFLYLDTYTRSTCVCLCKNQNTNLTNSQRESIYWICGCWIWWFQFILFQSLALFNNLSSHSWFMYIYICWLCVCVFVINLNLSSEVCVFDELCCVLLCYAELFNVWKIAPGVLPSSVIVKYRYENMWLGNTDTSIVVRYGNGNDATGLWPLYRTIDISTSSLDHEMVWTYCDMTLHDDC